jgi:hypothetical protein
VLEIDQEKGDKQKDITILTEKLQDFMEERKAHVKYADLFCLSYGEVVGYMLFVNALGK